MELLKKIKTEFSIFKEKLLKNINDKPNLKVSEDCCLIENSFIEEFDNILKNNDFVNSEIKNGLRIINNFEDAIKHINDGIKIILINKKIIELLGFNNTLNISNIVNYYGGNKKLIIEYKISQENKALLIDNPFNDIEFKSKTYIIINNQSKILYQNLLFEINDLKNNNNIISFKEYIMNNYLFLDQNNLNNKIIINDKNEVIKQNNVNKYNANSMNKNNHSNTNKKYLNKNSSQKEFKIELLKTFIYIFYYEKSCDEKVQNIFNNNEKYYIINPQWLNNYKNYYNYENLNNFLKQNNNQLINYNNLDKYIDSIVDDYLKFNDILLNSEKRQLPTELKKNIEYTVIKKFHIPFIFKGIIIPLKIMNRIKKLNKLLINSKEIIFKNNYIYYIESKNVVVGNYNYIPLFYSKYVFIFNDDAFQNEKKEILLYQINEYICQRKCNENDNNLQVLKNEENKELGKLIIVNQNNPNQLIIYNKIRKLSKKQKGKGLKRAATSFRKRKVGNILINCKKRYKLFSPVNNNKDKNKEQNSLTHRAMNSNFNNTTCDSDQEISKENIIIEKNNLVNKSQMNTEILKELEKKNTEIKILKDQISKLKEFENKIIILQNQLDKAKIIINNYKKKRSKLK